MFRFTIRDLLWLMVVVGLACGWWMQAKRTRFRDIQILGLREMVTSSGWMEIEKTGPDRYLVKVGKRAEMLMKELAEQRSGTPTPDTNSNQPATPNRP